MKKSYFQKVMEKLFSEKEENIQKLTKFSFNELSEMRKYYFHLYLNCKEMGYDEAEMVHYFKYLIINEVIEVKHGNE
jgi:hypothetical protein